MDLQTMGDNALTSENVPSIDNLRAHSPQTAGDSRPQPDTPIGLKESWRNANSCARCRSPGCAIPYEDAWVIAKLLRGLVEHGPDFWTFWLARSGSRGCR